MAGDTVARTAHFALHRMMLTAPAAAQSIGAPPSAQFQKTPQTMPAKSLYEVCEARKVCDVWMGAMVPKRWAKRAVTRNAIKRQIYNVGTLAEPSLEPAAYVVRLRAGFDKAAFTSATSDALKATARQELVQLFAKAGAAPLPARRALGKDAAQNHDMSLTNR